MNEGRDEGRAAQLGAIKAEVERRRDDQAVFRGPMGGVNLWRIAGSGPHRAFVCKKAELNTKSPRSFVGLGARSESRGRGVQKFLASEAGPVRPQHTLFRQYPKSFFGGGVV